MVKVIKWTNKLSNEQGYVKSVKKSDGHFVNTYDISEAKSYKRQCDAAKCVATLEEIGEAVNNTFEIVEID